jgi:tRNA(Ile)-lysidine synthase TilS/MesJ
LYSELKSLEKEIVMYAHFKKLDYFSTECLYSPNAYRGYVRELIKDRQELDFIFSKDMFDKINMVKPRAGIQSLSLNATQLANAQGQRNIETQLRDMDVDDLIKVVSIIFILVKYYNFDKQLIEKSKVMEYHNRLLMKYQKNKSNIVADSFEKITEDLFSIVKKILK